MFNQSSREASLGHGTFLLLSCDEHGQELMEKGANKLMDVLKRTRRFVFLFWLSEPCTVRGHFRRRDLAGYIREFAFFLAILLISHSRRFSQNMIWTME